MPNKTIEIQECSIPFVPFTQQYGRAEFTICVKWRYGKIIDLYITPKQQPDAIGKVYHLGLESVKPNAVRIGSYTHKGIKEDPRVWLHGYCPEHRAAFFHMYVPVNAYFLQITLGSSISLMFDNEPGVALPKDG